MVNSKDGSIGLLGFGRKREGPGDQAGKSTSGRGRLSILSRSNPAGSETSSSTDEDELKAPDEFVVECENEEMIFVTAVQGKAIKTRCRYFHAELLTSSHQLVRKPRWPPRTSRHLIELLSTGSTWIPNDEACFNQLVRAAEEVGTDVRLTSLINQHDILNKVSTDRFFPMIDPEYLQFKIHATVKSSQWATLMRKGILMLLQPKVLVVKLAPNNSATPAGSSPGPSLQRLDACDHASSEFTVYSKGNVKTLLTVLDVISPLTSDSKMARRAQPEAHKLVFKTRCGSESPEDLQMLLRMSTASYTQSNVAEQQHLKGTAAHCTRNLSSKTADKVPLSNSRALVVTIEQKQKISEYATPSTVPTATVETTETSDSTTASDPTVKENTEDAAPVPSGRKGYEYRTLSGTSFVVLKHLFDSVSVDADEHHRDGDECDDKEELPVCLMVANPTPDTLGRFVNAACLSEDCDIGFDLRDNCFFVSSSASKIKRMLEHLADYSHSAVVHQQFKLYERLNKQAS
jgi:hypothetical protein